MLFTKNQIIIIFFVVFIVPVGFVEKSFYHFFNNFLTIFWTDFKAFY